MVLHLVKSNKKFESTQNLFGRNIRTRPSPTSILLEAAELRGLQLESLRKGKRVKINRQTAVHSMCLLVDNMCLHCTTIEQYLDGTILMRFEKSILYSYEHIQLKMVTH